MLDVDIYTITFDIIFYLFKYFILKSVSVLPFFVLIPSIAGFLTRDELRVGCEMLSKHNTSMQRLSPEELDKIVDTMDINRDGEINFNEFLESFRMVDSKFAGSNGYS